MAEADWAAARQALRHPVVTLLTDFGLQDPFVGVMKGVLVGLCPDAQLVDLTHDIAPQNVRAGAFWLDNAYSWFPAGTVHLAVVDPGVGTSRRAVVVKAAGHCFVAPDNGLLDGVRRGPSSAARVIDAARLGLVPRSRTFHGRDVFAPVAGRLASGALTFEEVGPEVDLGPGSVLPDPRIAERSVEGEVLVVDRFGNLVSNVVLASPVGTGATVRILGRSLPLVGTYADLAPGDCGAVVGSFGQVEVVRRNGSAAGALGAKPGTPVLVDW
jgi:S-adenosylmethionine hydrolase